MRHVDINADVGEDAGFDEALIALVSSANICCGAHAGSEETARSTARLCLSAGVRIGAHPGWADRQSFGREHRAKPLDIAGLVDDLVRQTCALSGFPVKYIKPHGALYNQAAHQLWVCDVIANVLSIVQLPLMGMPGTLHETAAKQARVRFIREGFADRRYGSDGLLVPRTEPHAILDESGESAQWQWLLPNVDSLCLHGDAEGCVARANRLRAWVGCRGYSIGHGD